MGNKLSVKRFKSKKTKAKETTDNPPDTAPQVETPLVNGLQVPQVLVTSSTMDRNSPKDVSPPTNPTVLEIYTRGACPFTEQVCTALTFKNVEFMLVKLTQDPEWFKVASPEGTVPDGTYKNSSTDMLDWIDATYPEPALPKDTDWIEFVESEFIPAFSKVMMGTKPVIQEEFRPKLKAACQKIVDHLKTDRNGPYFNGAYSRVDVLLTPFLRRLILIEFFRAFTISDPDLDRYIQTLETTEPYSKIATPITQIKTFLKAKIPKMPPMSAGRLQHKSIRSHFNKSIQLAKKFDTDEMDDERAYALSKQLYKRIKTLIIFIEEHAAFEEHVIYPVFEEKSPGSTKTAHSEHEHEGPILAAFKDELDRMLLDIEGATKKGASRLDTCKEQAAALLPKLEQMSQGMDEHMAGEEKDLFPMTEQLGDRQPEVFRKVYYHCCHVRELLLPFVLEPLNGPERMQYMYNIDCTIREKDPEEWKKCQLYLKQALSQHEWEELVDRLPTLAMNE